MTIYLCSLNSLKHFIHWIGLFPFANLLPNLWATWISIREIFTLCNKLPIFFSCGTFGKIEFPYQESVPSFASTHHNFLFSYFFLFLRFCLILSIIFPVRVYRNF